ncbi:dolichyl-phosphate-mannose-protein mannosyltransferase [Leptospira inadai serovar Lyme str. 10]|uniref:Dolichyl-phosphate-mannose-protein mannosyltransferase n=2 Tax=Leptospira inadai serovar Lyme TaxID=293084 RepID=V6HP75_9LEPT|nr:glycosyltransferase family 39 protein [Leptospira inadai]EQA38675.1 dolichyl-phosphate-mannose-protein mannosyltransferase [Leptospira inadai serovar Lyme str. 10]PNV72424.1 dolichyl-phosphate-mannose--protein mannosyltransferase [Leptospira inadai serovar Lyme]
MNSTVQDDSLFSRKFVIWILLGLAILPILLTFPLDVIDIDSSQYAEISREMADSGDWFFIRDNGRRYLDKPILTFWSISSSFVLFGQNNFAFRLPAILLTLVSLWGIFTVTKLHSGSVKQGWLAVLLYALSPGLYAMVVDPKIDVYVTPYIILVFAFYYLGTRKNSAYYYAMYLAMGLGFVTKGPIAVVIPGIGIGGDILFRRDWKRLLGMKLFPGVIIAALPPLLWSIPLYLEFNTYGPYFFLWVQSFGRFYVKMYDQKFNPGFFYANFGWAFGVFILPFLAYILGKAVPFLRRKGSLLFSSIRGNLWREADFVPAFWLFVFLFLISFSKYQLPQYIYWCLPAAAVLGSGFLMNLISREDNALVRSGRILTWITCAIFVLAGILLPILSVTVDFGYIGWVLFYVVVGVALWFLSGKGERILTALVISTSFFFTLVSMYAYPLLISYQPSKEIGKIIQEVEPGKDKLLLFGVPASKRSYAFYSKRYARTLFDPDVLFEALEKDGERLIVISEKFLPSFSEFTQDKVDVDILAEFPSYKVATPEGKFFLKSKRESTVSKVYLAKIRFKNRK